MDARNLKSVLAALWAALALGPCLPLSAGLPAPAPAVPSGHLELLIQKPHAQEVTALKYSPDGKCFATAARGEVKLWSADGVMLWDFVPPEQGIQHEVKLLAFTDDSRSRVYA